MGSSNESRISNESFADGEALIAAPVRQLADQAAMDHFDH